MFKKLIIALLISLFVITPVSTKLVKAQTWYFQDYADWHARVYDDQNPDEIFGERYTAAQVEWVIYGLAAFIINHVVGSDTLIACVIENAMDEDAMIAECVPIIGDIIGALTYNPIPQNEAVAKAKNPIQDILSGERPLSGFGYIRDSLNKFNLVPEAKAQGFGFQMAGTVRTLWVAIRNITYFFLVLITIAMSFMIMFRMKISPQTVISVQTALPKIIIALILITFSYAIAGFMIDLLYVVIGIIAAVLSQSGLFQYPAVGPIGGGNVTWSDMYSYLAGQGFGHGLLGVMFFYMVCFEIVAFLALASNPLGFIGAFIGVTEIIWLIVVIVVSIMLLVIMLKIMWMLLKTFVTTLLLIAVGPLMILMGSAGGGGFAGWLKSLASNLAVFAAVGPMLALSFLFLASALPNWWLVSPVMDVLATLFPFHPAANVFGNSSWIPPFLALGSGDMDIIWLFASVVVMTLIPHLASMVKSAIQGRPFAYGTAIGAALGAGWGIASYPVTYPISMVKQARERQFTSTYTQQGFRAAAREFLTKR